MADDQSFSWRSWLWVVALSLPLFLLIPFLFTFVGRSFSDGVYAVTGAVLLWYTFETRGMRREMAATRRRLEMPDVSLRLERVTSGFFDLVIENQSEASALNVAFSEVPDLPLASGRTTGSAGFLRNGLRYLPPRQQYRTFFLNYPGLSPNLQNSTVRFVYSFENQSGERFPRVVEINLSLFSTP